MSAHIPSQPNLDVTSAQRTWSLRFWLLTAVTGLFAGLLGGVLMALLHAVEHLAWQFHEGNLLDGIVRTSPARHVYVLLAAGLLVGVGAILIHKFLGKPGEADGAIWFRSGKLPTLSTLTHAVVSIITVGMGSSLGRESPIKQAGGTVASRIAEIFRLSRPEQRVLVACGVASGMAAAYNVPVGGALFAVEVLLGSLSLRLALPALLCSGIATAASWLLLPTTPVYEVPEFPLSAQLTVWAVLAGPLLGLASIPLVRTIGWADRHKPKTPLARILTPLLGFAALGALSIPFPQILGNGKDAVQLAFDDKFALTFLLILPLLKFLTTVGCIRVGAAGGLFTPAMTIGALLGALTVHLFNMLWPGASVGAAAVIGSCAFLAAASQGPISSLVLVLELTRHVDATMVPMLLCVVSAMLVARRLESRSIYSVRLHPVQLPPLADDQHPVPSVSAAVSYANVVHHFLAHPDITRATVIDHDGLPLGTLTPEILAHPCLGAMPIEVAKAADLLPLDPLDPQP